MTAEYKTKCRDLLANLRDPNNPNLKTRVMSGDLPPAKLATMSSTVRIPFCNCVVCVLLLCFQYVCIQVLSLASLYLFAFGARTLAISACRDKLQSALAVCCVSARVRQLNILK
jgi:hypothetical protein